MPDIEFIANLAPKLLAGLDETLLLAASALSLGFILAILIATMTLSQIRPIRLFAIIYVYIFRSTPLLVQIFLIYYGSAQFREFLDSIGLWIFFRNAWFCAITALTLNSAAYSSEIIRGAIQSVPYGQIEAARTIGMSGFTLFKNIIFPIALRQALPAYGNEIILMIKATSLASTITILEITAIAKKEISLTFQTIEVFIVAGALYLAINFIISRLLLMGEYLLSPHNKRGRRKMPNAEIVKHI